MPICSVDNRRPMLSGNLILSLKILLVLSFMLVTQTTLAQTLVSITVTQIYDPNEPTSLGVAALRQFTATGNYSDGSTQYLTQQVTWTSENAGIATVTPTMGLVTAVAPGTVNIDATLGSISGSSSLTVVARTLTGLAITPATTLTMLVGTAQAFTATGEYGDSTIQDMTASSVWSSSNPAVATVSSTGQVTAVATGTTTITAVFGKATASTSLTVSSTTPPNLGQWTAPQSLGMLAIHAAMLYTGNVLVWGYPIGRRGGPSPARIYNPVTNSVTDVTVPWALDIFCAGQVMLPDGTVLVDGGTDDSQYPADSGILNTNFFDPSTNTWSQGPNMSYARWYPTVVELPEGNVLALSGAAQNGTTIQDVVENYNPSTNTWTNLPISANIPPPAPDLYPLLTMLGNGQVFYAGPRVNSTMFNPTTKTWSAVANLNTAPRDHAAIALLPGGQKVMIVGGAQTDLNGGTNPTNTTETIDFTQTIPVWTYSAPLNIARYNHNLIYLADGSLLAVGGGQSGHYGSPVFQPELYSFETGQWTLMTPQSAVRAYHSTAVLLPDGRVFSAGSDSGTALENTYEIYSPPYLFEGDRPTITFSPSSITYGAQFTIATTTSTIETVALIRPGATTHANHMDDHSYVTLKFTRGTGQLTATAPANSAEAPPGYYMLVIVNSSGVPSVMPFVQVLQ